MIEQEPKKRRKKTDSRKAKEACWQSFSRYIRARDCIKQTGDIEFGYCITCNKKKQFKELQAGHFIGGRNNSVLFDEDIVNSQCSYCNVFMRGEYTKYTLKMVQIHGQEWVEDKLKLRDRTKKLTKKDFEEIRTKYEHKYEELLRSL